MKKSNSLLNVLNKLALLIVVTSFLLACNSGTEQKIANEKTNTGQKQEKAGASLQAAFEKDLPKLEKPENPSGNLPTMLTLDDVGDSKSVSNDIKNNLKSGKMCATFNYADIGLPCLRAYGKKSSCVYASGWGWVYFIDYEVMCAGTTLTVCYASRGMCG